MSTLNKLKRSNPEIFFNIVIEMGELYLRNICVVCGKKIKFKYHIQLCSKCRLNYLDKKYQNEPSKTNKKRNK
jgi:hypothetical protein